MASVTVRICPTWLGDGEGPTLDAIQQSTQLLNLVGDFGLLCVRKFMIMTIVILREALGALSDGRHVRIHQPRIINYDIPTMS